MDKGKCGQVKIFVLFYSDTMTRQTSLGKYQEHHSFSTLGNWARLGNQTDFIKLVKLVSNKYLYNLTHSLSFITHHESSMHLRG